MYKIENITANAKQKQSLLLPDGTVITLRMYFVSMQFGWFVAELSYNDFVVYGLRICNSPNMLHQFRNKIPFGLKCTTADGREPSQQQDFSSGASQLFILSPDECDAYTGYLTGEV
jgi:hypothetical protein